jgi:hypothetical protein
LRKLVKQEKNLIFAIRDKKDLNMGFYIIKAILIDFIAQGFMK